MQPHGGEKVKVHAGGCVLEGKHPGRPGHSGRGNKGRANGGMAWIGDVKAAVTGKEMALMSAGRRTGVGGGALNVEELVVTLS